MVRGLPRLWSASAALQRPPRAPLLRHSPAQPAAAPTAAPPPPSAPAPTATPRPVRVAPTPAPQAGNCDPSYPDFCIPRRRPTLDCGDIPYRHFRVVGANPHRFDGNHDGEGCELVSAKGERGINGIITLTGDEYAFRCEHSFQPVPSKRRTGIVLTTILIGFIVLIWAFVGVYTVHAN